MAGSIAPSLMIPSRSELAKSTRLWVTTEANWNAVVGKANGVPVDITSDKMLALEVRFLK